MTAKKRKPSALAKPKQPSAPKVGAKDLVEAADALLQKEALPPAAVLS